MKAFYGWAQHIMGGMMTGFAVATVCSSLLLYAEANPGCPRWIVYPGALVTGLLGLTFTVWIARSGVASIERREQQRLEEAEEQRKRNERAEAWIG